MRNLLFATSLTLLASACTDSIAPLPDPPVLQVTSPARSTIQNGSGQVVVTGTVAPSVDGAAIQSVMVNGVNAVVGSDGAFQATIMVPPGATLITTEATAADGGKATDTRSIEAGELRAPGANIENAVTVAMSKNAFAKMAGAAGTMIKSTDFAPMLSSMNPIYHTGDSNGPDCLFAQMNVDDFNMSNATITMVPVDGGLSFSAKLDNVEAPGHVRYAVACADGDTHMDVTASSITIQGTLIVTPDGRGAFATSLTGETVQISGLNIDASGIPGTIIDLLPVESVIEWLAPTAARMFMEPMMNQALGGLAGPQTLNVLGKTINVQVDPTDVAFDTDGGLITLDMRMLIAGAESGRGFIFTTNGYPSMNPGDGMQVGLADDLANSMLSQVVTTGLLNLTMPQAGGSFDSSTIAMTSPPMISADPSDGMMHLVLPDMMATFTLGGSPVGKAAINAMVDLQIEPSNNGFGIGIKLGTPVIHANALSDIPNLTGLTNEDLGHAVELTLASQITSISTLLGAIPLPNLPAGMTMKNMSVSADDGYVMMKGSLE